jgi:hypothetical protein
VLNWGSVDRSNVHATPWGEDVAVIGLNLGATKLAGALFDSDGDPKTIQIGLVIRLRPRCPTSFSDPWIGDTAAAPCGSELPGRPIAQATVRPLRIVLLTPGLQDDRRLVPVREEFPVQALVAEAAVEAPPVGVLPGAPRVDGDRLIRSGTKCEALGDPDRARVRRIRPGNKIRPGSKNRGSGQAQIALRDEKRRLCIIPWRFVNNPASWLPLAVCSFLEDVLHAGRSTAMATPRSMIVDEAVTPWYHCISRCVRRDFLFGHGKEHRKRRVVDRLRELVGIFAVDCAGFAVMDNHPHLLSRLDTPRAAAWPAEEVARRWSTLFPISDMAGKPLPVSEARVAELAADAPWVTAYQVRHKMWGTCVKVMCQGLGTKCGARPLRARPGTGPGAGGRSGGAGD